ncbi:RNA polymerase sigma-70 factor [Embleya sp. NPDC050493]|uniref:RNA polymerase sigma-70 factor n=1 Tax=Embleya sp. NPDC050493 TaxID=3363989 RepID=UPI0037BBA5D4
MGSHVEATSIFEEHRSLLFSVAYRMLGSAADAEDVVQDAWLRWSSADRARITQPKAYLVRIVTNLAVDTLRSARVQRESYVGPWLPEPILTGPDIAEDAARAESVSLAMLVVLESLTELERAVFILKEVFGFPYGEIAEAIDRSEATVRQLGHRARSHVQARRPRFSADRESRRVVTERFFAASMGGDLNELMQVLAPDVTIWTDGGGKVRAALRPIHGAEKVAAWLIGIGKRPYQGVALEDMRAEVVQINGEPAVLALGNGRPITVVTVEPDAEGRIVGIRVIANPDKLVPVAGGIRYTL